MTLAIDVKDLSKHFGTVQAVNHVSIQIEQGHITGFLGPNGSGKTTTLRMLCGLLTPDSGHGTCLGYDILTQSGEIKRHVGYMTQRFSLYADLSIRENLEFVARYDMLNTPLTAPSGEHERRWAVGVDYWVTPSAVLKFAYEFDHKQVGPDQNAFFIQFGIGL